MNLPAGLDRWLDLVRPHAIAWLLCACRLVPAAFLCPVLGGSAAPATVRLALCLVLGGFARFGGNVSAPALDTVSGFTAAFAHELLVGFAIGLVASLPFDAARIGGRLLDTLRGANAEAALPGTGSREAATGDLPHQLLVALAFAAGAYRPIVGGFVGSFGPVPAGVWSGWDSASLVHAVVTQAGGALAAGLAIGAPAAAVSLAVDAALGVAGRISPHLNLRDTGAPGKLLLGAAAVLFALGSASERLLAELDGAARAAEAALRAGFGG